MVINESLLGQKIRFTMGSYGGEGVFQGICLKGDMESHTYQGGSDNSKGSLKTYGIIMDEFGQISTVPLEAIKFIGGKK